MKFFYTGIWSEAHSPVKDLVLVNHWHHSGNVIEKKDSFLLSLHCQNITNSPKIIFSRSLCSERYYFYLVVKTIPYFVFFSKGGISSATSAVASAVGGSGNEYDSLCECADTDDGVCRCGQRQHQINQVRKAKNLMNQRSLHIRNIRIFKKIILALQEDG